jgi:hypothetical protein
VSSAAAEEVEEVGEADAAEDAGAVAGAACGEVIGGGAIGARGVSCAASAAAGATSNIVMSENPSFMKSPNRGLSFMQWKSVKLSDRDFRRRWARSIKAP